MVIVIRRPNWIPSVGPTLVLKFTPPPPHPMFTCIPAFFVTRLWPYALVDVPARLVFKIAGQLLIYTESGTRSNVMILRLSRWLHQVA